MFSEIKEIKEIEKTKDPELEKKLAIAQAEAKNIADEIFAQMGW